MNSTWAFESFRNYYWMFKIIAIDLLFHKTSGELVLDWTKALKTKPFCQHSLNWSHLTISMCSVFNSCKLKPPLSLNLEIIKKFAQVSNFQFQLPTKSGRRTNQNGPIFKTCIDIKRYIAHLIFMIFLG